jgi:hypothetical protein
MQVNIVKARSAGVTVIRDTGSPDSRTLVLERDLAGAGRDARNGATCDESLSNGPFPAWSRGYLSTLAGRGRR